MYWFAGGDRRAFWTVDFLRKQGLSVANYNVPGMTDSTLPTRIPVLMLPFPVPEKWEEGELLWEKIGKGSLVLGGKLGKYKKILEATGAQVRELCDREPLKTLNAVATVEGALALMIEMSTVTVWESDCLVIGGGRIGMLLGERLRDLGARVTVSVRSPSDEGKLRSRGIRGAKTGLYEGGLCQYDFVVNTVPAPVLDGKQLSQLKNSCVLIELASAPGGFSQEKCKEFGFKTVYGPGLPGRYSPETAGILYGECLLKVLKEEGVL